MPDLYLLLNSLVVWGSECSALVAIGGGGLDNTTSKGSAPVDVCG